MLRLIRAAKSTPGLYRHSNPLCKEGAQQMLFVTGKSNIAALRDCSCNLDRLLITIGRQPICAAPGETGYPLRWKAGIENIATYSGDRPGIELRTNTALRMIAHHEANEERARI